MNTDNTVTTAEAVSDNPDSLEVWDGSPLQQSQATDLIRRYSREYGEAALLLSAHLAPFELFNADIVALVRVNFLQLPDKFNTALDADVLFGLLTCELGCGYYRMDKEVRWHLMLALNQWGIKHCPYELGSRTRQVAQLALQYFNKARNRIAKEVNLIEKDYLNRIGWVALGYADPMTAAELLAEEMHKAANKISSSDAKNRQDLLRFTKVRPLLELPLSSFSTLLGRSHVIESLVLGDEDKARRFASNLPDLQWSIGKVTLPSPATMLRSYGFNHAFKSAVQDTSVTLEPSIGLDSRIDFDAASTLTDAEIRNTRNPISVADARTEVNADNVLDFAKTGSARLKQQIAQLFDAIIANRSQEVKSVVSALPTILYAHNDNGITAFHLAAAHNRVAILELLLDLDNAVHDVRDSRNNTALISAAANGSLASIQFLYRGADQFEEFNDDDYNCYHVAIANGQYEAIEFFLNQGIDVNCETSNGVPALVVAVKCARFAVVDLLLRHGANIDYVNGQGTGILSFAARGGNPRILEILLEFGLSANAKCHELFTPLMTAAYHGQYAAVNYLLGRGADPFTRSKHQCTALLFAAEGGNLNVIKRLMACYPITEQALTESFKGEVDNWYALSLAALRGNTAVVKFLLSLNGNLAYLSKQSWNLLHLCCQGFALEGIGSESNYPECVEFLLQSGIDVNIPNGYGDAPLHIACRQNQPDIVATLLKQEGIDVNAVSKEQLTPFLLAVKQNSIASIRTMATSRLLDFESQDKDSHQALWIAVDTQNHETVKTLLEFPKINRNHYSKNVDELPLWLAVEKSLVDIFQLLCADRHVSLAERNQDGNQLLHVLAKSGNRQLMDILLECNVDINALNKNNETPLIVAINNGNSNIAAALLKANAYPYRYPQYEELSPLSAAISKNDVAMLSLLLSYGASINETDREGRSLLHLSCARGAIECIEYLIDQSLTMHLRCDFGKTPFHSAIESQSIAVINLILKHGADINAADENGLTPLHYAIRRRFDDLSAHLIEAGADINQSSRDGWTALHFAALYNLPNIVGIILRTNSLSIDMATLDECLTPLQIAARSGAAEVCKLLISYGAQLDLHGADNLPAIFLAAENGFDEIVSVLKQAGAAGLFSRENRMIAAENLLLLRQQQAQSLYQKPQPASDDGNAKPVETQKKTTAENPEVATKIASNQNEEKKQHPPVNKPKPESPAEDILQTLYHGIQFQRPIDPVLPPWLNIDDEKLLKQINPIDGKYAVDPRTTQMVYRSLPFYQNIVLVRVKDQTWQNQRLCIFYLVDKTTGNLFRLNGTSPPIHEVNLKAPLRLNESNVIEYLKFFCFFVRGDEGPFYVLESKADRNIKLTDISTSASVIEGTARPVIFNGQDEEGNYLIECTILYSNAVFMGHFLIRANGMVDMLNDEPVAGDLEHLIDVPIA
ncbi:ankyrin repeat domain-containing protein [Ketobacter sp.]|uniref:ankyrin repeat domain-containing protein n=1 Tax=Ketobacter sp. TaxID=2083498 RepID=UPI0025B91D97|nr:ankyrin repeat domain-containing protein [Ketobacter sp.]